MDAPRPTEASVVIPAHDEEAVIGRCLEALARQAGVADVEVVVVANGCSDRTAEVAHSFAGVLPRLRVVDRPEPGKVGALNAGDAAATAFPRIYLDADIELADDALAGLVEALTTDAAVIAAPGVRFDLQGSSAAVRAFYRVFIELPYAREGLVGLGVYGLSAAGRARFGAFPDVIADDLFAQRTFALDERRTTPGSFVVRAPRTLSGLVQVRTRVAQGNAELAGTSLERGGADTATTTASTLGSLKVLVRARPALAFAASVYVAVTVLARLRARRGGTGWRRDESSRVVAAGNRVGGQTEGVEVAYLVSQYPAPSHVFIEREIAGLRALGARVDTFSVRPTPEESLLSDAMRAEAADTTVLLADRAAFIRALVGLVRRRPAAVRLAVARAAASGEPLLRSRVKQMFYLVEAVRLHEELERRGLRHLHVHFSNNGADIARLVVELGRAVDGPDAGWRWTMTVHGPTEFEAVARFDLAAKVSDAAAVACISDFTRSQLMRLVDPVVWARLHRVRMSVDTSRYRPADEHADGSGSHRALRVLSVGRLVPEKGAPVLLDAVARLRAAGRDIDLRIVGSGPLESALRQQIDVLGLGKVVTLTGPIGQDKLPVVYQWADLFCLPSFQEGLPVVLMEAMASGLPVVTTAIAGIPELVVDRVNGRVVPAGRADAVAAAIQDLADDAELRAAYGREGRERVEREFGLAVTAKEQEAFLRSASQ